MSDTESTLMTFRKGFITAAGAGTLMLALNAWAIWSDTQSDRKSAKEFIVAQQQTNQIQAERNHKIDDWIKTQNELNTRQAELNAKFSKGHK